MRRKLWIFDMDGTLTDSMVTVWYRAPEAILNRFGLAPKPDLNDVLLSMDLRDSPQYMIREYDLPLDEAGYWQLLNEVVPQLYRTAQLKPGVPELLARLRAEGARLCICSNTWAELCREVLTRLGVAEYFEFFITAQGPKSKAHPEVFFEALERLGGADAAESVVCEDALYSARTAHEAGFYVVAIADVCSRSDEPALRRLSDQFLPQWSALEWDKL